MFLRMRSTAPALLVPLMVLGCDGIPTGLEPAAPSLDVLEAPAAIQVTMVISPQALILGETGPWVTVHADVPFVTVAPASLFLQGVPAASAFADDRGDLVVKVHQGDIEPLVAPPSATLTLIGMLKDGTPFYGADDIAVKERAPAPGRR